MDHAKQYLNVVQEDYMVRNMVETFHAPDARKWTFILLAVELLLCIPTSNGHLERAGENLFSIEDNQERERRSSLGEDKLDHLV